MRPRYAVIGLALSITAGAQAAHKVYVSAKDQGASQTQLESGIPETFSLPAGNAGALFFGTPGGFVITVPPGAVSMLISLQADFSTYFDQGDLDLFVRVGQPPRVEDGRIVADYGARSFISSEMLTITTNSNPPLQAGDYFIATAQFTADKAATATISPESSFPTRRSARRWPRPMA